MTFREIADKHGFKPKGILHVGAAMLEEAEDYHALGVERVVWVEALPPAAERQAIASKFGHELYEGVALSDSDEVTTLHLASNGCSTSLLPMKEHLRVYPDVLPSEEVFVFTTRADSLFQDLPLIDTLVIDVQGAELPVLKGMGKLLDQMQRCWIEVNEIELYEGCALQPELDDWMDKAGFTQREYFQNESQAWGDCLYQRPDHE